MSLSNYNFGFLFVMRKQTELLQLQYNNLNNIIKYIFKNYIFNPFVYKYALYSISSTIKQKKKNYLNKTLFHGTNTSNILILIAPKTSD